MFCPNCGDGRASESRFCPRCGFRLDGVTELLANNGVLPVIAAAPESAPPQRRKGVKQGAKIMFLSGVLLPIFFGFSIAFEDPGPMLVPLTVFIAGLARFLYSKMFDEDAAPVAPASASLAALRQPGAVAPYGLPKPSAERPRGETTNPLAAQAVPSSSSPSPRRRGMKQGAKIMFLSGVLLPLFIAWSIGEDDGGPLIVPTVIFFIGLCWTLYCRLFREDDAPAPSFAPPQMAPAPAYRPPMRSLEAPLPDANALHPPSVLEHTTRTLESAPRPSQSQTPQS
jgi:hypothetical protein